MFPINLRTARLNSSLVALLTNKNSKKFPLKKCSKIMS